MSANCEKGYSVGTLVKCRYSGGRTSIGIIVGIEEMHPGRRYIVYIDNNYDKWGEWFLKNAVISAASQQGLDRA